MLHSDEEGEIVDFINDKMVTIDVNGVKFPVHIDQIDFPYFKRFSQKTKPEKKAPVRIEQLKKEKPSAKYGVANGVWLVFLPVFDKDIFDDDYLGESALNENGVARIKFSNKTFSDLGNLETTPDFYFVLVKEGVQIFESKVMEDLDVVALEQFKMGEGEVMDLGTFLVEG